MQHLAFDLENLQRMLWEYSELVVTEIDGVGETKLMTQFIPLSEVAECDLRACNVTRYVRAVPLSNAASLLRRGQMPTALEPV